jgi:hypothetical protein
MINGSIFWWANLKKGDHIERRILKWQYSIKIYFKRIGGNENDSFGFGCYEHGSESPGFMKCREFLGYLKNFWLLRKV